jgi:hypothetical protein
MRTVGVEAVLSFQQGGEGVEGNHRDRIPWRFDVTGGTRLGDAEFPELSVCCRSSGFKRTTIRRTSVRHQFIAGIILGIMALPSNAASVVYHYEGQILDPLDPTAPPNIVAAVPTTITNITATIVLTAPVVPGAPGANYAVTSFAISDGANTFTTAPSGYVFGAWLQADSSGALVEWAVGIGMEGYGSSATVGQFLRMVTTWGNSTSFEDETIYCGGVNTFVNQCSAQAGRYAFHRPGTWTVSSVPIPAAVWLFGSALGLMGVMRRKVI